MPSNTELQVISKIIETRDFHTIERLKINEDFFLDPQNKEVFRHLYRHYHNTATWGQVPSWEIVRTMFPGMPYVPSTDALSTLCEVLRCGILRSQLIMLANEIVQRSDVNPRSAAELLRDASVQISSQHEITEDYLLSNAHDELKREYELIESGQGLTGLPWPWQILNEDTQGIHRGSFYLVYGRPKSMKTWVALVIACNAYIQAKARVLIYSLEMKPIRVLKRCAAIIAGISYENLMKGKLNPADRFEFFDILRQIGDGDKEAVDANGHMPALMVTGRTRGDHSAGGVSTLQSKIREFRPDLVVIDGLYLMRDDRGKIRTVDWKSIAHISQDVKGTADSFDVPIIGVTQGKRGSAKSDAESDLDELAYADALGQDCDMAMRVKKRKDPQTGENELILGFPGTRDSALEGFVIHGEPATNFRFKTSIITPDAPAQQTNNSPKFTKTGPGLPNMPAYGNR